MGVTVSDENPFTPEHPANTLESARTAAERRQSNGRSLPISTRRRLIITDPADAAEAKWDSLPIDKARAVGPTRIRTYAVDARELAGVTGDDLQNFIPAFEKAWAARAEEARPKPYAGVPIHTGHEWARFIAPNGTEYHVGLTQAFRQGGGHIAPGAPDVVLSVRCISGLAVIPSSSNMVYITARD